MGCLRPRNITDEYRRLNRKNSISHCTYAPTMLQKSDAPCRLASAVGHLYRAGAHPLVPRQTQAYCLAASRSSDIAPAHENEAGRKVAAIYCHGKTAVVRPISPRNKGNIRHYLRMHRDLCYSFLSLDAAGAGTDP